MGTESPQPHFVLIPLMCPSHLIPLVDLASLLSQNGVVVTIVTTLFNASWIGTTIDLDIKSGIPIWLLKLQFLWTEVGLPEGCRNVDTLPRDAESGAKSMAAASLLQQPIERYLEGTRPIPSCLISDRHFTWTSEICHKLQIPRLGFDGMSCFAHACSHFILASRVNEKVLHDQEAFVVPGLSDRIELTKAQLPPDLNPASDDAKNLYQEVGEADKDSFGLVTNTFQELEST